jgi:hypothetical protein
VGKECVTVRGKGERGVSERVEVGCCSREGSLGEWEGEVCGRGCVGEDNREGRWKGRGGRIVSVAKIRKGSRLSVDLRGSRKGWVGHRGVRPL